MNRGSYESGDCHAALAMTGGSPLPEGEGFYLIHILKQLHHPLNATNTTGRDCGRGAFGAGQ